MPVFYNNDRLTRPPRGSPRTFVLSVDGSNWSTNALVPADDFLFDGDTTRKGIEYDGSSLTIYYKKVSDKVPLKLLIDGVEYDFTNNTVIIIEGEDYYHLEAAVDLGADNTVRKGFNVRFSDNSFMYKNYHVEGGPRTFALQLDHSEDEGTRLYFSNEVDPLDDNWYNRGMEWADDTLSVVSNRRNFRVTYKRLLTLGVPKNLLIDNIRYPVSSINTVIREQEIYYRFIVANVDLTDEPTKRRKIDLEFQDGTFLYNPSVQQAQDSGLVAGGQRIFRFVRNAANVYDLNHSHGPVTLGSGVGAPDVTDYLATSMRWYNTEYEFSGGNEAFFFVYKKNSLQGKTVSKLIIKGVEHTPTSVVDVTVSGVEYHFVRLNGYTLVNPDYPFTANLKFTDGTFLYGPFPETVAENLTFTMERINQFFYTVTRADQVIPAQYFNSFFRTDLYNSQFMTYQPHPDSLSVHVFFAGLYNKEPSHFIFDGIEYPINSLSYVYVDSSGNASVSPDDPVISLDPLKNILVIIQVIFILPNLTSEHTFNLKFSDGTLLFNVNTEEVFLEEARPSPKRIRNFRLGVVDELTGKGVRTFHFRPHSSGNQLTYKVASVDISIQDENFIPSEAVVYIPHTYFLSEDRNKVLFTYKRGQFGGAVPHNIVVDGAVYPIIKTYATVFGQEVYDVFEARVDDFNITNLIKEIDIQFYNGLFLYRHSVINKKIVKALFAYERSQKGIIGEGKRTATFSLDMLPTDAGLRIYFANSVMPSDGNFYDGIGGLPSQAHYGLAWVPDTYNIVASRREFHIRYQVQLGEIPVSARINDRNYPISLPLQTATYGTEEYYHIIVKNVDLNDAIDEPVSVDILFEDGSYLYTHGIPPVQVYSIAAELSKFGRTFQFIASGSGQTLYYSTENTEPDELNGTKIEWAPVTFNVPDSRKHLFIGYNKAILEGKTASKIVLDGLEITVNDTFELGAVVYGQSITRKYLGNSNILLENPLRKKQINVLFDDGTLLWGEDYHVLGGERQITMGKVHDDSQYHTQVLSFTWGPVVNPGPNGYRTAQNFMPSSSGITSIDWFPPNTSIAINRRLFEVRVTGEALAGRTPTKLIYNDVSLNIITIALISGNMYRLKALHNDGTQPPSGQNTLNIEFSDSTLLFNPSDPAFQMVEIHNSNQAHIHFERNSGYGSASASGQGPSVPRPFDIKAYPTGFSNPASIAGKMQIFLPTQSLNNVLADRIRLDHVVYNVETTIQLAYVAGGTDPAIQATRLQITLPTGFDFTASHTINVLFEDHTGLFVPDIPYTVFTSIDQGSLPKTGSLVKPDRNLMELRYFTLAYPDEDLRQKFFLYYLKSNLKGKTVEALEIGGELLPIGTKVDYVNSYDSNRVYTKMQTVEAYVLADPTQAVTLDLKFTDGSYLYDPPATP